MNCDHGKPAGTECFRCDEDAGRAVLEQEAEGRVCARTVKISVSEILDLRTGYARRGWHEFLWLSGWKARVAVFVLKLLA